MGKVLIIGGAGCIGCVLVEELPAKVYSVGVSDRLLLKKPVR